MIDLCDSCIDGIEIEWDGWKIHVCDHAPYTPLTGFCPCCGRLDNTFVHPPDTSR